MGGTPDYEYPLLILMVGVNGVGKTTAIGRLANQFQKEGKKYCWPQGIRSGGGGRAAGTMGRAHAEPICARRCGWRSCCGGV